MKNYVLKKDGEPASAKSNDIIWAIDLGNPPFNLSNWGGENLRHELCL